MATTKFNNVIRDIFNTNVVISSQEIDNKEHLNTFPLVSGRIYTIIEGYVVRADNGILFVNFIDDLGFVRTISLRHLARLWYHEHKSYTYNLKAIADKILNNERIEFTYISVGH